jgi:hypothetical protein
MPDSEVAFMTRYLFDDEAGAQAVARIDRRIDRLPGQDGLGLLAKALEEHRAVEVTFTPRPERRLVAA